MNNNNNNKNPAQLFEAFVNRPRAKHDITHGACGAAESDQEAPGLDEDPLSARACVTSTGGGATTWSCPRRGRGAVAAGDRRV